MNKLDSIIFDLDGTLWSTTDTCVKTLSDFKQRHPDIRYNISAETIRKCMGLSFDEIISVYYGYLDKEKATKYGKEALEENVVNISKNGGNLYPKLKETIEELSKHFNLFIVSNCIDGYIESFLNTSGLKDFFIDYESHGRTKLNKGDNIKLIIERNNLKNSIYVGDTISDKTSAKYAGIPFVYASYGFGEVEEYDYIIHNISDLLCILDF